MSAGVSSLALHTRRSSGTNATYYTTRDHLGSSTVTMDANGALLVELSFAAFGQRRGVGWNDVPSSGDWNQCASAVMMSIMRHLLMIDVTNGIR